MDFNGTFWLESGVIAAGDTKVIVLPASKPFAVSLAPEAAGSAAVQFTLASGEALEGNVAIWQDLVATEEDAKKSHFQQVPVRALSITATDAACAYEVLQ